MAIAAVEPQRPAGLFVPLLIAVLLIPAVLGSGKGIFDDGDVSWHIATGQWILAHRAIPNADPFSFTRLGTHWVPIEWLSEVILALCYRVAGYAGLAALVTAALIALHAIVFSNAGRWTRFALLTIVAMDFVLVPMMVARPHLLTWPLLALWTGLMMRARERESAPPIVAALLMALWANLHGSFVFGLAIAGVFGLEALLSGPNPKRALRQWLPFGLACLAAVFINGNGVAGVLHPFAIARLSNIHLIDEWKPSNPAVTPFFFAVLALTIALIAWKRPRLPLVRWLLLGGLVALALFQTRQQAMLAIVAAMILPQGFARRAGRPAPALPVAPALAIAAAGALLLVVVRAAIPLEPPESDTNPWKLIAMVPPQLRSKPVLNGYSMGGPLILSGIRPYMDGRGDVYGDALVFQYAKVMAGDPVAFADVVQRWNIQWAIVPIGDRRLIALLDRSGWRRIAGDGAGLIYLRQVSA